ncbi:hypothetical protein [Sphingomonas sp. LM7]|uniref:hypothetical protein n=1 Tax=Sphingomonas sp. LM7 TaxID=1938607 RepID=UPI0015C5316C|nr:hypothetical protein [Sphingomonas sp. LM7]
MPRWLFPLLVLLIAALAALLVWAWSTDYILIDKCLDAGGVWEQEARVCALPVTTIRS